MACVFLFGACVSELHGTSAALSEHFEASFGAAAAVGRRLLAVEGAGEVRLTAPRAPQGLDDVAQRLWELFEAFEVPQQPVMQRVVQEVLQKRPKGGHEVRGSSCIFMYMMT